MFKERIIIERRHRRIHNELIKPAIWSPSFPFEVRSWAVPVDSDGLAGAPVSVLDAVRAKYGPIAVGSPWGAPWATTWFKFNAVIPEEFEGRPVDAILNLGFTGAGPGFQAEGMVWSETSDGEWVPFRGLHPTNHTFRLTDAAVAGTTIELLVEAASNPHLMTFTPDRNSDLTTAGTDPIYRLGGCSMAVVNTELLALDHDYQCVTGWISQLPENEPRCNDLLVALQSSVDAIDPLDVVGSASRARAALAPVLAAPASASAHRISAIGHAHIDTAWLWPLRETVRKCARTFSNVLRLMETQPEFKFGCSQAVQYEWMRQHYPSIFDGIVKAVARGQWVPIGGQWVEADGNITGGESHIRQMVHGQRYFREHFDVTCGEVWIPDVFGYPATLPQFFRLGRAERFLTQKLSWNRTNRFPHHTFWWEGIDGSRVYTHFPPVENYNATLAPWELMFSVHNFNDHGVAHRSLMPFGHGDGGGGPTQDMLEQYQRSKNLDGSPRIAIESPREFFDAAMLDNPEPPVWVGELYFETHRGSYTSQARTKVGNRRAEVALREAELWSTVAFGGSESDGYPATELDEMWKTVLTHQFHDILPGTSIGWVHREAEATYAEMLARLDVLIDTALDAVDGRSTLPLLANASPFGRDEIVVVDSEHIAALDRTDSAGQDARSSLTQRLADGRTALRATLSPLGCAPTNPREVTQPVVATERTMRNGVISVTFGDDGSVTSLVHLPTGRQVIAPGERANRWQLHHDLPLEYDAWDIEAYYRDRVEDLEDVESIVLTDAGPLIAHLTVTRRFRSSRLTETFELRAGSPRLDVAVQLDWQERDHLLKVAWPVDVSTTEVVRDIQYGHIRTPIHTNTTWDAARFELCAHKWIDVGEPAFGVALLNNGRYGHDVTRTRSNSGAATTTMRLTVVKGSQFPDPEADRGQHNFVYSVMPHAGGPGGSDVIAEGYRLNMPVRAFVSGDKAVGKQAGSDASGSSKAGKASKASKTGRSTGSTGSTGSTPVPGGSSLHTQLISVSDPSVLVEVVKAAEDRSGDLIIRLWESLGNKVTATIELGTPVAHAWLTDALEDGAPPSPEPVLEVLDERSMKLSMGPFQIATLRLKTGTAPSLGVA